VQTLAASNGVYRIRAAKGSDRDTHTNYVYSFVKAVSHDMSFGCHTSYYCNSFDGL